MRRIYILIFALLCVGTFALQTQARSQTVAVVFKPETDPQLIDLLRSSFKLRVLKKERLTYLFEVPALKRQEQFTELFASLPSVQKTDPAPVYHLSDQIQPQAVYLQPIPDAGASSLPEPEPSAVAGSADNKESVASPGLTAGVNTVTSIPLDGGNQMLISFKPGTQTETVHHFHLIYGTQEVKKVSFYKYRVQLPAGLNPGIAVRIFKLFPEITNVQRLYA